MAVVMRGRVRLHRTDDDRSSPPSVTYPIDTAPDQSALSVSMWDRAHGFQLAHAQRQIPEATERPPR